MADTIRLGDICRQFGIANRDARYVLEQGLVPAGVDRTPLSGNHRQFSTRQAFWFVIVLKLKAVGIRTPLAAEIADRAEDMLRGVTQRQNWEWTFDPAMGRFRTENRYLIEVGDLALMRLVTDANTFGKGLLPLPWLTLGPSRVVVKDAEPFVIVQIDLALIGRHLEAAFEAAGQH